jgi:hypothetical protein
MKFPDQNYQNVRRISFPCRGLRTKPSRLATHLALAFFFLSLANGATAQSTVTLPIEVVGENGTTSSVAVEVPARRTRAVRSLWMQVHGLGYADMVSVQVNTSAWFSLNNDTTTVAEPGKSYGGMGGGFSTLKVTLPLPANTVVEGANTIRFRFNYSNGVVSGFRVLAFDLLAGDSSPVLEPDAFTQEDPNTWTPPLRDSDSIRVGQDLWQNAQLMASSLPNAQPIHAHCSDCHAHDGRDLKYFSFSNASIIARSRFHSLSDLQGQQIASYIRSLPVPSPGRPWNPPYQPGPGLDAQPVAKWAAGAGLSWVLDSDSAALAFIFAPNRDRRPVTEPVENAPYWSAIVPLIKPSVFSPDGNLNPREIPISLQLPDWNHWLPRVHPLDAWGPAFQNSEFSEWYGSLSSASGQSANKPSLRNFLASPDLSALISSGRIVTYFDKWRNARRAFLKPYVERKSVNWSPDLSLKAYSTQLWQLVKTWEMTQEFGLEGRGRELFGVTGESRTWLNTIPEATAPSTVNITDGPAGMGGSALTNEYFDASWYGLEMLVNCGNHLHRERLPVDWVYLIGRFLDLYRESRRPEPARLLVAVIKAMQSTDPGIGPDNRAQGWRPGQNVDPTIMVSAMWAPIFEPFSSDAKRAITESLLAAWLDKNLQYPLARYFTAGLSERSYAAPASLGGITGGNVWELAPVFMKAGVNPEIVRQLEKWGTSFTDVAARFQYAPRRRAQNRAATESGVE